jgi:hypothetical protein
MTWDGQFTRNDPHPPECDCDACRNSRRIRSAVRGRLLVMLLVVVVVVASCSVFLSHH